MKFTTAAFVAGMATSVNAKASFTNTAFNLVANTPFNLTWSDSDGKGPYTLYVMNGESSNLKQYANLGPTDDLYLEYTPSSSMPSDTYAFKIVDSTGIPNYSKQWTFSGSASSSASVSGSTTSTSASSSSSASSTETSSTSSSASATVTSTMSGNSTTTSGSPKSTTASLTTPASATTSASKTSSTPIVNTNGVQRMTSTSPVAFLLAIVAGLVFFN